MGQTIDQLAQEIALRHQPAMVEPAPPRDTQRLPRWLALAAGNGLDAFATELALRRPETYEANPLMRGGPGARAAIKAGSTIGTGLLLDLLAKKHPKLANAIGFGAGGAMGAIGVRNLTQGKK